MNELIELKTADEEDSFVKDNKMCVIFFGSKRCGHCQHITPSIIDFETKYPNVKFAHVEMTKVKCENVEGAPTFIGYENGIYKGTVLGADINSLEELIEKKIMKIKTLK